MTGGDSIADILRSLVHCPSRARFCSGLRGSPAFLDHPVPARPTPSADALPQAVVRRQEAHPPALAAVCGPAVARPYVPSAECGVRCHFVGVVRNPNSLSPTEYVERVRMSDLPGRVRGRAVFSGDRVEHRQEGLLEIGRMLVDAGRAVAPARRVGIEREALGGFERRHAGCELGIGPEGIQPCQHGAPVGYGRRDVAVARAWRPVAARLRIASRLGPG